MPRPFSPIATCGFAVLTIAVWLFSNWSYLSEQRIALVKNPQETALWLLHHDMMFHEGATKYSGLPKTIFVLSGVNFDRIPRDCERVLRDVIGYVESPHNDNLEVDQLRANLAVLLAESGSLTDSLKELALLKSSGVADHFVRAFHLVYGTAVPAMAKHNENEPSELLVSGWARWRFEARYLRAIGDNTEADSLEEGIAWDARLRFERGFILYAAENALQIAGLLCLAILVFRRREYCGLKPSTLSPPWTTGKYWGLFVRGVLLGHAATLVLGFVPLVAYFAWLSYLLVLGATVSLLLWRRHWRHNSSSFRQFFGIPHHPRQRRGLLLTTLALFAVGWVSLLWIPVIAERLGFEYGWEEGLDEVLLMWPWSARFIRLLDGVIWGPIYEEIVFRGLLYGALRNRFSASAAAGLSALVFAGTHIYSMPGFLAVAAFGFFCALARKKTGSLLPCILAHALTNLLILGGDLWVNH